MKKPCILLLFALIAFHLPISAEITPVVADKPGCIRNAWFKYPQTGKTYPAGSNVYVRVDPQKYQDIASMELYVNGAFVRKEATYPFEWCKGNGNSDHSTQSKPGHL